MMDNYLPIKFIVIIIIIIIIDKNEDWNNCVPVIPPEGKVYSLEKSKKFAQIAQENFKVFSLVSKQVYHSFKLFEK